MMKNLLFSAFAVIALGAYAHGNKKEREIVILQGLETRTVMGPVVIYETNMSGTNPHIKIVTLTEQSKRLYQKFYLPDALIEPMGGTNVAEASVQTRDEYVAGLSGPTREANIRKIDEDLKGRSAVVWRYLATR